MLTDEQVNYARTYCECKLRQRYGRSITDEDLEDCVSYCLRKLVMKWDRHYDPTKSRWKTYIVCVLKSAVNDVVKWQYRQRQRLQTEPLDDSHDCITDGREDTVEKLIDEILDDQLQHDVALLKWRGWTQREICKKLKLTKQQYVSILAEIHDVLQKRIKRKE